MSNTQTPSRQISTGSSTQFRHFEIRDAVGGAGIVLADLIVTTGTPPGGYAPNTEYWKINTTEHGQWPAESAVLSTYVASDDGSLPFAASSADFHCDNVPFDDAPLATDWVYSPPGAGQTMLFFTTNRGDGNDCGLVVLFDSTGVIGAAWLRETTSPWVAELFPGMAESAEQSFTGKPTSALTHATWGKKGAILDP